MARQWQTVLVSVAAHVVAVFLLVVVPLLAFDGLPSLKSTVKFVAVEMKVPPTPPAPVATPARTAAHSPVIEGPPLNVPNAIVPERPPAAPPMGILPGVVGAVHLPPGVLLAASPGVVPPAIPRETLIRPGGNVQPPQRVSYVRPAYPPVALAARVSGSVFIEAIIGTDGLVRDARVIRSIPLLDDAALKAVRQWRYTPTLLNGVPVAVVMTVTVTFAMDSVRF